MDIQEQVLDMQKALKDEISAMRRRPNQVFDLREGRQVDHGIDGCLMSFRAEIELPMPADTPVELHLPGQDDRIAGHLVEQQDFAVLLHLQEEVEDPVRKARLTAEPTFIYEAMRRRLEELKTAETSSECQSSLLGGALDGLKKPGEGQDAKVHVSSSAQEEAVERAVSSGLHFVWGPPGTGKTTTLAKTAQALVSRGERVLIVAHSNVAVDVALLAVARAMVDSDLLASGKILRVGRPRLPEARARLDILPEMVISRQYPELIANKQQLETRKRELTRKLRATTNKELKGKLIQELREVRQELAGLDKSVGKLIEALLAEAVVIGATLSRTAISDSLWNWSPSAILVDETSMAPFPVVFALSAKTLNRMVLFGDFRQLPPVALSTTAAASTWLARDAFDIAGVTKRVNAGVRDDRVTLLDTQYRMCPPIADVVSRLAYDGRLKTAEALREGNAADRELGPWSGTPIMIFDTSELQPVCQKESKSNSFSRFNPLHALAVLTLVNGRSDLEPGDLAVVSPYRAQARLLASGVQDGTEAATVHRFQGSERNVIVFDLVDGPLESGPSLLTGRDADIALRLTNVAISRAKGRLLVMVNIPFTFNRHPPESPVRRALQYLIDRGTVVSLNTANLREHVHDARLSWYADWSEAQRTLVKKLSTTTDPVLLNLPVGFDIGADLLAVLSASGGGPPRAVVCAPYSTASLLEVCNVELQVQNPAAGFFAVIGKSVAMLGGMSEGGVVGMIESEKFVRCFLDQVLVGDQRD